MYLLTYLFTYLLTYLFTYLLTYLFIYLLTYSLTYSMEHCTSWEANRFAASQGIPHILWNPNVYYRIHMCPTPVSVLSQLNPIHTPTSHFLKICLNIILPSTPGSPHWSLWFRFSHQNPVHTSPLPHTPYIPCPSLQVPNLISLFRCSGRTKVSVQVRGFFCEYFVTKIRSYGKELLARRPTPKLEDHLCRLSATAYSI
jgi:hypothetical protein